MSEPPKLVKIPKQQRTSIAEMLRSFADDIEAEGDTVETATLILDGVAYPLSEADDTKLFNETVTNLVSGLFEMFIPDPDAGA